MEAARAIQHGDAAILCANEHQILYEIELRVEDCSTEHEDYMTYWIASHKDHETATDMFEVFMNTVQTSFTLGKSEEIMELYSSATMIAAAAIMAAIAPRRMSSSSRARRSKSLRCTKF